MLENATEMKDAITVYGDKASMFVELILKDADNFVNEISVAIEQSNAEDVGLAAHSLKSIMKQIHANNVAELAFDLEKAGKDGVIDGAQEKHEQLKAYYAETKDYLLSLSEAI